MNNTVENTRNFLKEENVNFLLVNSTNSFLVEYNSLEQNSRYLLTDFTGSTGDALLSQDSLHLFVDGRYHIQADLEVNHDVVDIVKLQTGQTFIDEIVAKIKPNSVLGIFSKKNSQCRIEMFEEKLKEKNVKIKLLDTDPIDKPLDVNKLDELSSYNVLISKDLTEMTVTEKIQKVSNNLNKNEAILVTNLEEVSYLLNMRNFSVPYTASITAKVIIVDNYAYVFDENTMHDFAEFIKNFKGFIYVDKSSLNGYDYNLIGNKVKILKDSPVKLMKAVKTDAEIAHMQEAFLKTDKAVSAIRDFIENNENISEYDIAQRLEEEYKKYGAVSLSFKPIVAIDKNSALAHYSKSSKDEIIKNGSLVLIDSGAYYEGGLATDITRVFVKGEPSDLHKKVYTTALKAFLNTFNFPVTENTNGFEIDDLARGIFAQNPIDGFVFNHGLGHGIGVSVHEYPPSLSKNETAKVEIKDNMCFSIEPGLYNIEHFGVRLENSCYMKDRKIRSFVNMNYEKKLIDFDLLSEQEKEWLKEFEVK